MKAARASSHALAAGAALVMLAVSGPASAANTPAPGAVLHVGDHAGFGRIVIDANGKTTYTLDQDGDHVVVRLSDDVPLGTPPAPPRNVIGIVTDGPVLDLVVQHGAQARIWRTDGHLVIDIMDDPATVPPVNRPIKTAPQPKPNPPLSMASSPELGGRSAAAAAQVAVQKQPLPTAVQPAPAGPQPGVASQAVPAAAPASGGGTVETTQQTPPGRDVLPENDGPLGLRARRTRLPKDLDGTAFLVPFGSTTGAAAFRSGDSTYVVFDERRPVDMAGLAGDPVFAKASIRLLPTGTLLRIPHPATLSIALTQLQQGWRIAALTALPKREPIAAVQTDGRLNLMAEQPGDVISMADPDTGATLLVGTQHRPGQGIASGRRSAEFILRQTDQGVVVEPLSDTISLKQTPAGFTLSGPPRGLALSPPESTTATLMDAARLTRRLNFSTMPTDALMRLEVKQIDDAASTPPLARGPKHHAAAETLLSLGMSAEAGSLLHIASEQDPKEAASADTTALSAIAALLAGRPEDAAGIMDPRLDGTDEIALWRAVREAMQDEGSPRAAAVFAATAPLVFQYPVPIRDHVLPLIAETMIQGGEIEPAKRLLEQRKDDPKLAYARALLRQAGGDTTGALAMLDALAGGHDQFDRARAAVRAVELRLAAHQLDKTQAADALDKLLYAWRGDSRELALRERVADLRGQTGAWRTALAMLRQAETDFPNDAADIHERLKDTFAGMIRDRSAQQMPPIQFVATVDDNADLMPDIGAGNDEAVAQLLADRLLALDLPDRAKPVLEKLLKQAKSPTSKARFGASLAAVQLREGDDADALSVLDASKGNNLPPDLAEHRLILQAQAVAHKGDAAAAAALLAPIRTNGAAEARAQILENASNWAGAAQAWSDCAALTLPDSGALDEGQTRIVLRLATATARADDEAGLAGLRDKYSSRLGSGPLADMFRLLTVEPIRSAADIGRSKQEVSLATSLPAGLKALQPVTATR